MVIWIENRILSFLGFNIIVFIDDIVVEIIIKGIILFCLIYCGKVFSKY